MMPKENTNFETKKIARKTYSKISESLSAMLQHTNHEIGSSSLSTNLNNLD